MTHLLFTVVGVALLAITLPLVLELALVTLPNLVPGRTSGKVNSAPARETTRQIAIIVPAHNEGPLVSLTVASLRTSTGPDGKILVVAHNCSDDTAAHAAKAGAEVLVYNDPTAVGKGFALRYGFHHALSYRADAVMVVDADSIVTPNTLSAIQQAFADGARVVQCRYEMVSTTERSSTRLAALAFRAFNVIRPRGRARLGFSAGILGNGFAIDRTVLEAVPYDAFSVVEDLEYHLHLVIAGERVHYLDEAVIHADFPESKAGESVQRSRWEGGRLLTARMWALPLMGKILRGRFRLIEPLCDLTGLPMAFGVFALVLAVCLPLAWLRWYAACSLGVSPLYVLRKLWMIPGVLRGSSAKAAWVRTERNNTL
jgi:cellulose synthase/poly-beta-1,6-N-acetylglucosamine synthase-like glycosyltransferase